MKIAPTLQRFAAEVYGDDPEEQRACAELRALLAVARAAADRHGWTTGANPHAPKCYLCRVLARLERVSKVKP